MTNQEAMQRYVVDWTTRQERDDFMREHGHAVLHVDIYALMDPRDLSIRYIGKAYEAKKRFYAHLHAAKAKPTCAKDEWLREILETDQRPLLMILKKVPFLEWRQEAIRFFRDALSCPLFNIHEGGNGQ